MTAANGDLIPRRHSIAAGLAVMVFGTMLVFFNTLTPGRVWEDDETVLHNAFMSGPRRIPYLFTPEYWRVHDVAQGGAYRPFVQASFALEYPLWGSTPMGYHVTNALLHTVATVLCYVVFSRLTGRRRLAVFASLVFAVHPTRTEAVCWLKNRAEILCSIFLLLSLLSFAGCTVRLRRGAPLGKVGLSLGVLAFAAALLCKGLAIVFPLVLVAYAFYVLPKGKRFKGALGTLPFWVVVAGYIGFKLIVLEGDVPRREHPLTMPLYARVMMPGWTALFYEKLLVLPARLCADRDLFVPTRSPIGGAALSAMGLVVAATPFALAAAGRLRGAAAFMAGWFLIILLPYLNVMLIEVRPLADQRTYLPALSWCYLLACGGDTLTSRWSPGRRLPMALIGLIVAALTCMTVERNFVWQHMFALFHDAAAKAPRMARVHANLGTAYYERGRVKTAKRHLVRSVTLDAHEPKPCRMLGLVHAALGEYPQSIKRLKEAWRLRPESVTCRTLGKVYLQRDQWDEAKGWLEKAVELRPDRADGLAMLAACHWHQGNLDTAAKLLERSVAQDPTNPQAWTDLGTIQLEAGRAEEAVTHYQAALGISPSQPSVHHNMGLALLDLKREPEAQIAFQRALSLDRGFVASHLALAGVYRGRQQWRAAAGHLQAAIRSAPRNAMLWYEFALVLERFENPDATSRAYDMACTLAPRNARAAAAAGDLASRHGQHRRAFEMFAQALKADPESHRARLAIETLVGKLPAAPSLVHAPPE